jgi:hypothetical protein
VGREARKIPAEGDVFFLDFYLYRTVLEAVVFGLGGESGRPFGFYPKG